MCFGKRKDRSAPERKKGVTRISESNQSRPPECGNVESRTVQRCRRRMLCATIAKHTTHPSPAAHTTDTPTARHRADAPLVQQSLRPHTFSRELPHPAPP
eukprot:295275-Prymnesium_polylepis.1